MNLNFHGQLPILSDRKGWPWQPCSKQNSLDLDVTEMPRISVITPSYNQGKFIEQTIRSVLLQNYPNLEYIIIDGGSTDNTIEIIKKYSAFLTYWVSEKDSGQSSAINKGLSMATGDIFCWINSDDMLSPNSLSNVVQLLNTNKNPDPNWLIGGCEFISDDGTHITNVYPKKITFEDAIIWTENSFPQPAVFWNQAMWKSAGKLNESWHYAMDFDLWLSMIKISSPLITKNILGVNRCQSDSKTSTKDVELWEEMILISDKHSNSNELKQRLRNSLAQVAISCNRIVYSHKNRVIKRIIFAVKLQPSIIFDSKVIALVIRTILGKKFIDILKKFRNLISISP